MVACLRAADPSRTCVACHRNSASRNYASGNCVSRNCQDRSFSNRLYPSRILGSRVCLWRIFVDRLCMSLYLNYNVPDFSWRVLAATLVYYIGLRVSVAAFRSTVVALSCYTRRTVFCSPNSAISEQASISGREWEILCGAHAAVKSHFHPYT